MKPFLFTCLAVAVIAMTGCSELSHEQIAHYKDYGISDSLYAKMQSHRRLNLPDIAELSQCQVQSSEIMTYLAFSNTEILLSSDDIRWLWREKVNGDVITYLREKPNHSGGLLATFHPNFYTQIGMPGQNPEAQ